MKILGVIPARYASSRFPGKPLAMLGGKMVIEWVWERVSAMEQMAEAVVATDDERIKRAVEGFGGKAMMTSDKHRSGTDRCGEVLERLEEEGKRYDVVVNIQGDEPFVEERQLKMLAGCFEDEETEIATLVKAIGSEEELWSKNNVKVVRRKDGSAMYFSRQAIPCVRGAEEKDWLSKQRYYKHIGIYAFRSEVLKRLVRLEQTELEKSESLEQLRWLENGYRIATRETEVENIGIDTPEDLELANKLIEKGLLEEKRK